MQKKIFKYLLLPVLSIILALWVFKIVYDKIEQKKEKEVSYILPDSEKTLIKNGDIVLRYGHGLVSDYIVKTFKEKYPISHCGIIRKKNGNIDVIHSESSSFLSKEGIQVQDFDSFTDAGHKNSIIIVRYNKCNPEDYEKITERAEYYLKKNIPFDYAFNPDDTSAMFCSEIIWHIFSDVFNDDIFSEGNSKPDFNQFKIFYDTAKFDIIINDQTKN